MRGVLILAGVMIGLGTVMAQVADHMMAASATTASSAPSVMVAAAESPAPASGVRSVVVPRDRHGHFQTEGRIEGQRIKFMVDTGASVVAMNESSAARMGVRPVQSEFNAKVTTANGVIK
ncbi:MAG: TIGR02281 family clan AA aspartic protease, partial [Rhizobiales bacterium]|nr:TIGR02281 family clan AA aspartic protease [Hyphomicrobiales bacterium]